MSKVQGTNDSSIVSKCSMANLGYFEDPYLKGFVSKVTRRAPLIHRGYYIRAKVIDYILKMFIAKHSGKKQIISLGAGFDSSYFRLRALNLLQETVFFEVDFSDVVKRKWALIKSNAELLALIDKTSMLVTEKSPLIEMTSASYKLLGVDLSQTNTLEAALKLCDADFDAPTLLLSECVLTYMTRKCSSRIVKWAGETFLNSVFVLYEQINPDDAFGLFMQKHFHVVGSPLKCINSFPSISAQKDRFVELGWCGLEALDMNDFYNQLLSSKERERIEKLEMFDEYEEWHLKCSHYMVLCGYHGNCCSLLSDFIKFKDDVMNTDTVACHFDQIKVIPCMSQGHLKRFAHGSIKHESGQVISVGGFGEQNGKHMRITEIAFVDLVTLETVFVDLLENNNKEIEVSRMHGTVSCLKDGRILLIGGRLSPLKMCSQIVEIQISFTDNDKTFNDKNCLKVSDKCINCDCVGLLISDQSQASQNIANFSPAEKINLDENIPWCVNCSVLNVESRNMNLEEDRDLCKQNISSLVDTDTPKNKSEGGGICEDVMNSLQTSHVSAFHLTENMPSKTISYTPILKCSIVPQTGDIPIARWRHSAIVYEHNETEVVVIFGGRSPNILALGDCYMFTPASQLWRKLETIGSRPEARQAHTACLWKGKMVIAGGLHAELHPLNSVYLLNLESLEWTQVPCDIKPRYSHSAHVIDDYLVLVGGVSFSHCTLGIAIVHLPSGTSAEFAFPQEDKDCLLMFHRHTSVVMDNNRILLLGGGGNCFSFGTHLNCTPVILDIRDAMATISKTCIGN